ncbi:Alpha 1,4-glycosyltransferase domain [Dillenia turbinata]|uniref:Alpha 1,4-glycosyltransferase domain n=1 Tax=Dillenia turbinata TaxID=194707 RepID=A0AAN8ZMQ4_9MAGN
MHHNWWLRHAKFPIFSTISIATIFLVITLIGNIFNVSLNSIAFRDYRSFHLQGALNSQQQHNLHSAHIFPLSIYADVEQVLTHEQSYLIALVNASELERAAWIRKKLEELEIFKMTKQSRQFDNRVRKFFSENCKIKFFMIWIAPARFFRRRETLALESLFKTHPKGCLIILSITMDSSFGYLILKPLLNHGFKVLALAPDLPFLFKDTPAETWFQEMRSGIKNPGEIPLAQNLSNLLRLTILYKYGGVYLDTDIIALRSFSGLRNSIGAQSVDLVSGHWTRLNNAVLIFDKNHQLLLKFIEEFASNFDGNKWGYNGPYLVSRVVEKIAGTPGYNYTILPPTAFYLVDWTRIDRLFVQPKDRNSSRWVELKLQQLREHAYGLHLWNKQTSRLQIEEGSVVDRLIGHCCVICEGMYNRSA